MPLVENVFALLLEAGGCRDESIPRAVLIPTSGAPQAEPPQRPKRRSRPLLLS